MFSHDSRYATVESAWWTDQDGRTYEYKKRRHIPRPLRDAAANGPVVVAKPGDRPDIVAARALGDPQLFWHLCDLNGLIDPWVLAVEGRSFRVAPIKDLR